MIVIATINNLIDLKGQEETSVNIPSCIDINTRRQKNIFENKLYLA